jgi:hypothetical protein
MDSKELIEYIKVKIKELPDDLVLEILDVVSSDVKRRNALLGSSTPQSKEEIQKTLKTIIDALSKH